MERGSATEFAALEEQISQKYWSHYARMELDIIAHYRRQGNDNAAEYHAVIAIDCQRRCKAAFMASWALRYDGEAMP